MKNKSGSKERLLAVLVVVSLLFSGVNLYRSFDTGQVAVGLKDIVVENNGEYIRWKVKGSQDWNNLIAVKTLTGGSDIVMRGSGPR